MAYKVGEVANLAHVSVRTLHHYDVIGLLTPSGGLRMDIPLHDDDLATLQQVMFYKELGFGLEEICSVYPRSTEEALLSQREW
jgi:DNA-binding transcriptional MerR regulator